MNKVTELHKILMKVVLRELNMIVCISIYYVCIFITHIKKFLCKGKSFKRQKTCNSVTFFIID